MRARVAGIPDFPEAAYPSFVRRVGQGSYTIAGPCSIGRVEVQVRSRLFRVMSVRLGAEMPKKRNYPWGDSIPDAWESVVEAIG